MFHICQIRIFLLKSSKVIETFSVAGIIAEQVLQARQILQAEACSDPCSLHLAHITILCHIAYIFHLMMHIMILCHTASRRYHEIHFIVVQRYYNTFLNFGFIQAYHISYLWFWLGRRTHSLLVVAHRASFAPRFFHFYRNKNKT